jgi:predicted transposase YbfD/YdcC
VKIRKLKENISKINDPRRQYGYLRHKLETILAIAFCAILCGVGDYAAMVMFANKRFKWFSKHFDLTNGVPGENTFRRIFACLDPGQVAQCLRDLRQNKPGCKGKTVNIDGKTIRGSAQNGRGALHVVSAWVGEDHLTLGEVLTEEKSNEITAIPKLLDLVDAEGSTVTIDAMGCQKQIASKIVEKKAHYCLALKANHGDFYDDVSFYFENERVFQKLKQRAEKSHGRVEERWYALETDILWLAQKDEWAGLAAVGAAHSRVWEKGETREKTRYFITTLTDAGAFAKAMRGHWSIENQLHWRLDVTFGEDASGVRKNNAPLVWNVMRKSAIELLRNTDLGRKASVKNKMLMAAMDEKTMEFILFQKKFLK